MTRTLNGKALPDDCPCPIATVGTMQRVEGQLRPSITEELRPLTGCRHHGDDPGAVPEPILPDGVDDIADTNLK